MSSLEVRGATASDRLPIYRMVELYQHDLSDIWPQELDALGEYGYALDRYWREANCHAFVALVDGRYAGFALVDGAVKVAGYGRWIDQFFVLKKYRRAGIGNAVAMRVFASLPGYWEVGQMPDNASAQAFWRRVVGEYTDGNYQEHVLASGSWQGVVQSFESTARGCAFPRGSDANLRTARHSLTRPDISCMTDASIPDPQDITASAVRALVLYSLAEFQSGHATTIRVTAEGHSFSVADDGRGHAIDRTVAGQPYLKFVYTHLDYPFKQGQGPPVQLHAIGISLVNVLCSELAITARKLDATLRMSFINGQLGDHELVDAKSSETGNTISGKVKSQLQKADVDIHSLRQWLIGLLTASPTLRLFFNGLELKALAQPGVHI